MRKLTIILGLVVLLASGAFAITKIIDKETASEDLTYEKTNTMNPYFDPGENTRPNK
ncbi:hypothetical protein AB0Y20_01190 [Heyndrickxia oleronia]|uniref:hypothetical protein n=1 Tax=Heyndrickxia oleronia TaxID=38875 RepID=UPI003F29ED99